MPDTAHIVTSPSVTDIISANPGYVVRNGITIIFLILSVIIGGTCFISYPDTLEGHAVITTNPLPIRLKANQSGRIASLLAQDGSTVTKDVPIAELENSTGYSTIVSLGRITDSAQRCLLEGNTTGLQSILSHPLSATGEAQTLYNGVLQSISAYLLWTNSRIYDKRIVNIRAQMQQYQTVAAITSAEARLSQAELQQSGERFAANKKLYMDKVISRQEYYDEAARLRQQQLNLQARHKSGIQNRISAGENSKQLAEIEFGKAEKETALRLAMEESLRNLQSYIESWRLRNLLVAPFSGTLHYLRSLQVNETTTADDELFAVIPSEYRFLARVSLPSQGLGKLMVGQEAHLLMAQYPYNEYGYLKGTVSNFSLLPRSESDPGPAKGNDLTYQAEVPLPDTLITTHGHHIRFIPEMTAQARIITKDRSLLSRLLSGLAGK